MLAIDSTTPKLAVGCRWRDAGEERVLLFPEGALRLRGTGLKILELCDGQHTLAQLLDELKNEYAGADTNRMRADVTAFLERLHEKRIVNY